MNPLNLALASLLVTMLAGPAFAASPYGPALGCSRCVDLGATPTIIQLGGYTEVRIAVSNPLSFGVVGLVHVIVHDQYGKTSANSTGVFDVASSANGTATILLSGLNIGETYAFSFWAVSIGGVAISVPTTVSYTASRTSGPPDGGAPLGTDTLVVGNTSSCPIIGMPCETYTNASNSPIQAVAYLVLHNPLGQTVGIATALVVLSPGQQLTVSMPIVGANGTASLFAVSAGNFAISATVTASFRL
jgi:hypothetical protein